MKVIIAAAGTAGHINPGLSIANTIKKNKPRLAIGLSHKPEDILDIPAYIKELVPEYKLYIKHYYPYFHDTVLYAVFEGEKRD